MPIYVFVCPAQHLTEVLRPASYTRHMCDCGLLAHKRPARFAQLNPPTGAALRSQFSLYREATQEIDHAYAAVEASTGQPQQAPDLWGIAKAQAQAIVAAGEAPPPVPLEHSA